jgi:hypothetical protein
MENGNGNIYSMRNFRGIRTRFLKYLSYGFLIAWIGVLSSCTVGLRGRNYDDRNGYYQRQSDYYGERTFRNRHERQQYDREQRRWHKLHDNDRDSDHDHNDINLGR